MTLIELFTAIRAPYAQELADAIAASDAHVEPAFRIESGDLAVSGPLEVPYRADLIPRGGDGSSVMVNSTSSLGFEPFTVVYGECRLSVSPFVWDWAKVTASGLTEEESSNVLKAWFLRWFDPDDANQADEKGLFGVVHYLGDPKAIEGGVEWTVDFGSAPPEAVQDMIDRLETHGAAELSLS